MTADDRRTCPLCGTRVHLDTVDCPVCGAGLAGPDDDEFDDDGPWAFVGGQEVEPARGSAWTVVAAIAAGVVGVAALVALVWFVVVPRLSPAATAAPGDAPADQGSATAAPVPGATPGQTPGGDPTAVIPTGSSLTPALPGGGTPGAWTTNPAAPSASSVSPAPSASGRGSSPGSAPGSAQGSSQGSAHGSSQGSSRGSSPGRGSSTGSAQGSATGSSRGSSSRGSTGSSSGPSTGSSSRGSSGPRPTPSPSVSTPRPLPTAEDPSEYPPGTNEHGFFYETGGIPGALSHMGTLTKVTSPEFGRNVAVEYNKLNRPFAAAKVRAYSPTLRTYIVMDCVPYPDRSVGCIGGDNAQVEMW